MMFRKVFELPLRPLFNALKFFVRIHLSMKEGEKRDCVDIYQENITSTGKS